MSYNFDTLIERRNTNSIKWTRYPEDVLPFWVADMDFQAPVPIRDAIQSTLAHGVLGYEFPSKALCKTVAARMKRVHNWDVDPNWVVATPGVIAGFNAAAYAVCEPGRGLLVQPPVYPPFLKAPENVGLVQQFAPLNKVEQNAILHYEINWEVFHSAVHSQSARTGLFLLCHPHNPTGQTYSPDDLRHMAEICIENEVVICSDEIHNEHILGDAHHTPLATLSPEIAARTITLVAPSKTFNVPGLFCGFAIIPDPDLRENYKKTTERMAMHVSSLSLVAAQAAFSDACDEWLADLRAYLTASRDYLVDFVARELPGIRTTVPDATYIAWLDCSDIIQSGQIKGSPHKFFLKRAKVALSEGAEFGPGGENFVRFVFGCSHARLEEGLARIKQALT